MSGAVIAIYQVVGGDHRWVALAIAALGALTLQALSPPQSDDRPRWARAVIWVFIFVANTAVLASAALGISPAADEAKEQLEKV